MGKLTFKRTEPGRYTTDPDNQRAGYLITSAGKLGWMVYTPIQHEKGRDALLTTRTLAEAKQAAQDHHDRPDPLPAIRISPADFLDQTMNADVPDADLLQLLGLLDSGLVVTRGMYQRWTVVDPTAQAMLDPERLDAAARAAEYYALAFAATAGETYMLLPGVVHLVIASVAETVCGHRSGAGYSLRFRYTADPAKVTHDPCQI